MAIYKPSNCQPFLNTLDLTQNQYFTCELNTSNVLATGYKIQILDSSNTVIFDGAGYTLFPKGYALNGKEISVPFIIRYESFDEYNTDIVSKGYNINAIYYIASENKWYSLVADEGEEPYRLQIMSKFGNAAINQPFKWIITLAQGQKDNGQLPTDIKWYDMSVASGQVLGSTPSRIQAPLSQEILPDYYIQLCRNQYNENATEAEKSASFIAKRVLISRYDSSLGHIYPTEGEFTQADIDEASFIQVYKTSNDPNVLSGNDKIDYATTVSMTNIQIQIDGQSFTNSTFEVDQNGYYHQYYEGVTEEQSSKFIPYISYYDKGEGVDSEAIFVARTTRLLVKNEKANASDTLFTSPKNGVYVFIESVWDEESNRLDVKWRRASDLDSWAKLLYKVLYVMSGSSSGLSYESDAAPNGVIDSSPLTFTIEKPIVLYPDKSAWKDRVFGTLFKNSDTETFIRPFIGLETGMKLRFIRNNVYQYVSIEQVDKTNWSVKHSAITSLTPNLPYVILSCFKSSNENPFYGYAEPTLNIIVNEGGEIEEDGVIILKNRFVKLRGELSFVNKIPSWKNYQWILNDLTLNIQTATEVIYDGDIEYTFTGLQDEHSYIITLVVEDEYGRILTKEIQCLIRIGEIPNSGFPLKLKQNCRAQAIELDCSRKAVIVPEEVEEGNVEYVDNSINIRKLTIASDGLSGQGIAYIKTEVNLPAVEAGQEGIISEGVIPIPLSKDITINSQHSELSSYFDGEIYRTYIYVDDYGFIQIRIKISAILPSSSYFANGKWNLSEARNQIILRYVVEEKNPESSDWKENSGSVIEVPFVIVHTNGDTSTTWRRSLEEQNRYVVCALVDPANIVTGVVPNSEYDYILTSLGYNLTIDGEQVPDEQYEHLWFTEYNSNTGLINFVINEGNVPVQFQVKDEDASAYSDLMVKTTVPPPEYENFYVQGDSSNFTMWLDHPTYVATQPDGTQINVFDSTKGIVWDDEEGGKFEKLIWDDSSSVGGRLYKQVDINKVSDNGDIISNHSGRQEISNKELILNAVVENFAAYGKEISEPTEVYSKCFISNKRI